MANKERSFDWNKGDVDSKYVDALCYKLMHEYEADELRDISPKMYKHMYEMQSIWDEHLTMDNLCCAWEQAIEEILLETAEFDDDDIDGFDRCVDEVFDEFSTLYDFFAESMSVRDLSSLLETYLKSCKEDIPVMIRDSDGVVKPIRAALCLNQHSVILSVKDI